jgi:hypothetical protein
VQAQPDGTFALSTFESGDGAPAGEYIVTIRLHRAVQVEGDFVPGPNLLPVRYANAATSDIVVRISEGPNELPPIALRR